MVSVLAQRAVEDSPRWTRAPWEWTRSPLPIRGEKARNFESCLSLALTYSHPPSVEIPLHA